MSKTAKKISRRARKQIKLGKGVAKRSVAMREDRFAHAFKESKGKVDPDIKLGY